MPSGPVRARLVGSGAAVPPTTVPNAVIEQRLGRDAGWIEARTGIRERRVLRDPQTLLDLAEQASRRALDAAGVAASELDFVIVGTSCAPQTIPSMACQLQGRLGAETAPAFDLAAACTGFLYGLGMADGLVRSGGARTLLVVGADAINATVHPDDPVSAALFGDAAGAVVLRAEAGDAGVLRVLLRARGAQGDLAVLSAGGPYNTGVDGAPRRPLDDSLHLKGQEIFQAAVRELLSVTRQLLEETAVGVEEVALLIPHQANRRIIASLAQHLGLPMERVCLNLDRFGNTSAASVPLALDEAWRARRIGAGDLVVMNAIGGGLTWGASAVRL
jgi:3-oxoacyl-[acyl-carrier-protein] synthase-3